MKPFRTVVALAVASFCSPVFGAENFPPNVLRLMDNLSRNCQAVQAAPNPLPPPGSQKMWEIDAQIRYVERDLEVLRMLAPSAEQSSRIVRGQPFNATIQAALKQIKANRLALNSAPNAKALQVIDQALADGKIGAKWMANPRKYNATLDAMAQYYASYERGKQQAAALDPKVLELRKAEIQECDEKFVRPFLEYREQREREAPAKEAIAKTITHAEEMQHQRQAKEEANKWTKIAKKHGASGYYKGIASLIESLAFGTVTVEQAKSLLVLIGEQDSFKVDSTSEKYVFYILEDPMAEPVRIAVERNPGEFYGQGSHLQQPTFRVIGVGTFNTVSGAQTDLIIFRGTSESSNR